MPYSKQRRDPIEDKVITPLLELRQAREKLFSGIRGGRGENGFFEKQTSIVDHFFIRSVQESSIGRKLFSARKPFSLIALGGYGRGELCLRSDIDVMVLFPSSLPKEAKMLTEEIILPLWDLGMEVGHCVRSLKDCTRLSLEDFEVFTSLLDARFLCGESPLYLHLRHLIEKKVIPKNAAAFARWLDDRNKVRMETFGDASYLLEPNIKEGIGGLRDYHQILWLSKVFFGLQKPRDLEYSGRLSHSQYASLSDETLFLSRIRNHLHDLSGRKNDRLGFQYQEKIAERFGFEDKESYPAVEQFLGRLHTAMSSIKSLRLSFAASYILRGCDEGSWTHAGKIHDGLRHEGREIGFASVTAILSRPGLLMSLFSHIAECGCRLSMEARRLTTEFHYLANDQYQSDPDNIKSFLEIIKGPCCFSALIQMHETGMLDAFIPEFGRIKDRVQFDAYHIFPVGIHSIHTVKNLKELPNEKNLILLDIMNDVKDHDVLYIAALFHDIGKIGKNHAERGSAIIAAILERWSYDRKKSEDIVFLVRNHLLLVETATRRDLDDEKAVVQCASIVGTVERAKFLYLLTWADSKATGPSAWNSWISNLIQELFLKILHIIEKGELASPDAQARNIAARNFITARSGANLSAEKVSAFFEKMSPRYLLYTRPSLILRHQNMADELDKAKSDGEKMPFRLHAEPDGDIQGCWEVSIIAPDRAGLFSEISGVLALNNINILSASIYTWLDGTAVDIFKVSSPLDSLDPNRTWEKVKLDIKQVFSGRLALDFRLGAKAGGKMLSGHKTPPKPPRVIVENNSSDFFTIIEVFADDRIGLLYLITSTLSSLRLDIRIAKIATKGDQVADVFYVLDLEGQRIEDESRLREIQNALLHRVGSSVQRR